MAEENKRCPFCDELIRKNAIKCRHCGSVISSDTLSFVTDSQPDTLVKQVLGETYEINKVVGSGGMAVVFKAEQRNLQRSVALKVIHQNLIHEKEFVDRFLREARVGASLSHDNIVKIYDVGSIGTVHYMAMEYLEGETLRDIVRKSGKLTVAQTIKYIVPLAEALGYLHSKDLVHRDIKTANVIVTKQKPILTDFGIVFVRGETRLSQAGTVVGTPEYMSPEQATGKVEVDKRADIYSLGVMIYECLTGKVPFHSSNPLTTVHSLLNERPKEPKYYEKSIPMWLNRLILDCLIKDPEERIQDCSVIVDALRKKDYKGKPAGSKKKQKAKKEGRSENFATLKISGDESQVISGGEYKDDFSHRRRKKWLVPSIIVLAILIGSSAYLFLAGPPEFLPESMSKALDFNTSENKVQEKELIAETLKDKEQQAVAPANNNVTATKAEQPEVTEPVQEQQENSTLSGSDTNVDDKSPALSEDEKDRIKKEEADKYRKEMAEKARQEEEANSLKLAEEEKARKEAAEKERRRRDAEAKRKAEQRSLLSADQLSMLNNMGIPLVLIKSPTGNFYMGKFEVTQKLWQSIMGNNPSVNKGANNPVENVSKYDILNFLTKLKLQTSMDFRLPTLDEWNFAARANGSFKYSGSNALSEFGWYEGNTNMASTKPVGGKSSNAFGLYDMSGNVAEMCADGSVKGGSYVSPSNQCELSYTESWEPNKKDWTTGFRLCIRYERK